MSSEWFVRRGQQVRGPFDSDQLRAFARAGKLLSADEVRQGVAGAWFPAASVRGLFIPAGAPLPARSPVSAAARGKTAARAAQTPRPRAAPRGAKIRRKRTAFWIVLGVAVGLVSLGGTGMILFERGTFSFDFGGGSEASARTALSAELDKWMARQDHEAKHVELLMAVLLDYSIQSLQPVKTNLTDLPYADWDDYQAKHNDLPPTYLATVRMNVESRSGTALPRVVLYRLTRDPKARKWHIRDTMDGK